MKQRTHRLLRGLLVCLLPLLIATAAHAQVEIYAYFQPNSSSYLPGDIFGDQIGEGTQVRAVALQSAVFGIENPSTIGTQSGGSGAGVAKFDTLEITKLVDKISPTIFLDLASGAHLYSMTIVFRKPVNGTVVTFMKVSFKMVFFTSSSLAASSGDSDLSENIKMIYGAQQVAVYPIAADGTQGTPVLQNWSQVLNQPVFDAGE